MIFCFTDPPENKLIAWAGCSVFTWHLIYDVIARGGPIEVLGSYNSIAILSMAIAMASSSFAWLSVL